MRGQFVGMKNQPGIWSKRVAGTDLFEPVFSVNRTLVNVLQFRKQVRADSPHGQTCFLCKRSHEQVTISSAVECQYF